MARFRPTKLFRRFSARDSSTTTTQPPSSPPPSASVSSGSPSPKAPVYSAPPPRPRKTSSLPKLRKKSTAGAALQAPDGKVPEVPPLAKEPRESVLSIPGEDRGVGEEEAQDRRSGSETLAGGERVGVESGEEKTPEVRAEELKLEDVESLRQPPVVVVEQPTPDIVEEVSQGSPDLSQQPHSGESTGAELTPESAEQDHAKEDVPEHNNPPTSPTRSASPSSPEKKKRSRPTDTNLRHPSIVDSANAKIVKTLIDAPKRPRALPRTDSSALPTSASLDFFTPGIQNMTAMLHRKIWVKRPGASATLVQIREDDLVDDVRDMILRKYANSLGKTFDAPDMTLSITTRAEHGASRSERVLGPEEEMCRTIDTYYSGGQTVDEALLINVPQRRTPRPSPKVFQYSSYHPSYQALDDYRPLENGTDYFPPMPAIIPSTLPQTSGSDHSRSSAHHHASVAAPAEHPRSISVLNTGQIAPLPSPGAISRRHQHRPKYNRQPTSSPTILSHPNAGAVAVNPPPVPQQLVHRQSGRPRLDSSASEAHHRVDVANGVAPVPPPLPTPPAPEVPPTNKNNSQPPTPSGGVHRPQRPRKPRKENSKTARSRGGLHLGSIASMLDGSVPPINVLIVEDNIINLRILEGLMKRLKVRWQTAMNGQIAVDKWKAGGFHLVLMDIQMPVLNGLQATKEIRRLERVNGIGVFSEVWSPGAEDAEWEEGEEGESVKPAKSKSESDKLQTSEEGLFKSPVIIVALTASSLQSDRHEALAAGCNDFLTKPVNFVWLERKVKEWGCMQALIDFDGWRKWKEYAAKVEEGKTAEEKQKEREKEEKERVKAEKMAKLHEKQAKAKEEKERERKKRQSLGASEVGGGGEVNVNGGASAPSTGLRPGAEVLGEANFDLGG